MKKSLFAIIPLLLLTLSGCASIGDKAGNISGIYGATAVLSFLLFAGYLFAIKKKDFWFLLLFGAVLVVDVGYFCLSISNTLEWALWANRISYLGSVCLPMSMMMIILNVTKIKYKLWIPGLLMIIAAFIFFVASSHGYLDIYYKEVHLQTVNGVTVLEKTYGPWHVIYLVYLVGYFSAMVAAIIYAILKKKLESPLYATFLAAAVFVNIGVWLVEQLVKIDFEILSVSYIISEIFILGLNLLMDENQKLKAQVSEGNKVSYVYVNSEGSVAVEEVDAATDEKYIKEFKIAFAKLTPTEKAIYDMYTKKMTTKDIMNTLDIKENTLKFHNKNIYGKFGVSSRKQLMELHERYSRFICETEES